MGVNRLNRPVPAAIRSEPARNGHCDNLKNAAEPVIRTVAELAPRVPGTSVQAAGLRLALCCSLSAELPGQVMITLLPERVMERRSTATAWERSLPARPAR